MRSFAPLMACGLATLAGCQVSGEAEVDTTRRPSAPAPAAGEYTLAYVALEDNQWEVGPQAAGRSGGMIRRGGTVRFSRAPGMSEDNWEPARLPNGTVGYVRPIKYQPAAATR